MKNKSQRKILNNIGPNIDPLKNPKQNFFPRAEIRVYFGPLFAFDTQLCTNLKAAMLNLYAFSLAVQKFFYYQQQISIFLTLIKDIVGH